MTPKIVYRIEVQNDANNEQKFYFGVFKKPFKKHFGNHKNEFPHSKQGNSTDLPKYIWHLNNLKIKPRIKYQNIKIVKSDVKTNYYKLCLAEKLFIINPFDDK